MQVSEDPTGYRLQRHLCKALALQLGPDESVVTHPPRRFVSTGDDLPGLCPQDPGSPDLPPESQPPLPAAGASDEETRQGCTK